MQRSVVIDYLAESVPRYRDGWAIVVVDVIRATTTAITAASTGRRCFPVPSVDVALAIAGRLPNPVLAGESEGLVPSSFEMDNSPAQIASRTDIERPLILLSSSGTRVIGEASSCDSVYLACFRSFSALAAHLAGRHDRVAVIGAGTKGEFREEDQICCAWIAASLVSKGYQAESSQTVDVMRRWCDAPATACLCSRSVDFLKRTGKHRDLDFILGHVDDLPQVFEIRDGEVRTIPALARTRRRAQLRRSHAE